MPLPPIITTVREIINNAADSSTIPTKTDKTESTLFKREEILGRLKVSQKKESTQSPNRQIKSSAIRGKKATAQISTPQIPTLDFKRVREAVTVESASDKTPPATGTVEPIINFAVRRDKLSAEELTAVCMLKMPMNRVDIKPITQRDSFLTELAKFVLCIRGDTDAATLKERCPLIRGITALLAIKATKFAESSKIPLIEAEESGLPLAAIIPAKTGIKAVIKVAQP